MPPPVNKPVEEEWAPREESDELDKIRSFKLTKLSALGYGPVDAIELAAWKGRGVDVHYVEALLKRGATHEQAAAIAR